jgi:hypothetical protein
MFRAGRPDEPGSGFRAPGVGFLSGPRAVHARVAGLRGRIFQPGHDGRQREAADDMCWVVPLLRATGSLVLPGRAAVPRCP